MLRFKQRPSSELPYIDVESASDHLRTSFGPASGKRAKSTNLARGRIDVNVILL